jgi:hypothetical protein
MSTNLAIDADIVKRRDRDVAGRGTIESLLRNLLESCSSSWRQPGPPRRINCR